MPEEAKRIRVLVVEDDENLAGGLAFALSQHGIHVAVIHRGRPVPALVAALRPDVVVLDISLPDLNGIHVARLIRPAFPNLPIIFVTAHDNLSEINRAQALPHTKIVHKPFTVAALVTAIRAIIEPR
ncbi:MAG TPA: response regulator [Thermoanaerobaculia bacterium]|nr:response regulator [Thermoanaerobaculia bacterium]